jgi:ABC-2 type transport system permease protein
MLCLSLWSGTALGAWLVGPIRPQEPPMPPRQKYLIEFGPLKVRVEDPLAPVRRPTAASSRERLQMRPAAFGPALWMAGGLIFAVTGLTLALSAAGRFRWRVLGTAVLLALVQFLVNLFGQLWDVLEPLRPLTLFYYYQPQQVILGHHWSVTFAEWNGGQPLFQVPAPAVLYGAGLIGYALALSVFTRRDLPAPL